MVMFNCMYLWIIDQNLKANTRNIEKYIKIEDKNAFFVDKNVLTNTVLCSIVFKVLNIYCSIMYIIHIIIMCQNVFIAT